MTRYPDKASLKGEGLISAHKFEDIVHPGRRGMQQELEKMVQLYHRDECVYSAHFSLFSTFQFRTSGVGMSHIIVGSPSSVN